MKRELALRDRRINDIVKDFEKNDNRLAVCEKLLKFTNIQKKDKEWDEQENKVREMIELCFTPTQKRVIELQHKMGEVAKMYQDQQGMIDRTYKELQETMGMGKG